MLYDEEENKDEMRNDSTQPTEYRPNYAENTGNNENTSQGYSDQGYAGQKYSDRGYSSQNDSDPGYSQRARETWDTPENGRRNKKKNNWPKRIAVVVVCALLFGTVFGASSWGVNRFLNRFQSNQEIVEAETAAASEKSEEPETKSASEHTSGAVINNYESSGIQLDVRDIAKTVMPSMVSITNISVQEVQDYFSYYFGGGGSYTQEVESAGSGIIIGQNDTELLIATNNHVVADAETLSVCFIDNAVYQAHIKGTDEDNDLAVIAVYKDEISDDTMNEIVVAEMGDAGELEVGEQVVAIGNALGYGQSVTTGIISALNRQIDTTDAVMIQTDAAINPGNSGGALLNMQGQVIGINSAKFSDTTVEGMGYAISMTAAQPIIETLMNRETRDKVPEDQASYLGIYGEDVTSAIEATYGIPEGIYITQLVEGGPAEKSGLTAKMVITAFDGIKVSTMSGLKSQLQYYAAGETVEITVQAPVNGEYTEQVISVTLGAASEAQSNTQVQQGMPGIGNGFGR